MAHIRVGVGIKDCDWSYDAFIDGSLKFESLQFSPLFQFSLLLQWFVLISIDKPKTVQILIQKHRTALIMFQNYRIYYDLLR